MNILIVNGHLMVGGVEKSLVDLLKSIDYSKHKVDLLLFEGYGELAAQVPEEVHVILCDLTPTYGSFFEAIKKSIANRDWRSVFLKIIFTLSSNCGVKFISLMRLLKITPGEYDCAIAYRIGICADYVGYAVKAKKKMVWWHHGEFNYEESQVNRWRKTSLKMDNIVCVSEATKTLITPHFPEKAADIVVVPNMIIQKEIIEKSQVFHPYGKADKRILVSVGRMSPEKHMIDAVYAMEKLVDMGYSNLIWYLIGDGSERERIEKEISDKKLDGKIVCTGTLENPYPYIADADLFVHPSYVESQGLTVLEAFALGKTCVVTRSLGVEEFVVDGKNAFLAEQSIQSLTEKIDFALTEENCAVLDKEFQKETVKRFSQKHIVESVMQLAER